MSADAAARALATLPPRVRTAVVLRYVDGLSVDEVSAAMRLSQGAVKRYLSDGRGLMGPALGITITADASDDKGDEVRVAVVEGGQG